MKLRSLIFFFLIINVSIIANTKYITYVEHDVGKDEFNNFLAQRAIFSLLESPDGLILGGTAGGALGKAILFCYDPLLEYNPGYMNGNNPKVIFSKTVSSNYVDYYNTLGVSLIRSNSIPDTVYFVLQGSFDAASTIPYKIMMIDYDKIHDDFSSTECIDLGNSPNGLAFVTAFSYNDTYLAIAGDPGSGGKVEFFDIRTNSFVNTSIDIMSITSNRDYRILSLASHGTDFYAGTLTINNPAEILKIDKDFHSSVLFQPDLTYFDNDSTSPLITIVPALHTFNDKLYAGTESTSNLFGGMVFYYDLLTDTPKLLGKAVNNTHTYGIQDLTDYNGEVYGSTKAEYNKINVNDKNSWGRIFKISSSDSIMETQLIDYRGEIPDYNPAIIPSICPSHSTNDIIFGTQATYIGNNYVNYGGLMGKTDFYPPNVPKCLSIIKKDSLHFHIKLAPAGDDMDYGNASYYEIKGASDRIISPIEYMSLKTIAFSTSSNLEIETLYYPFLYFKAYDNVMNVSSMGVIENNFFSAKLYPNP
ncbi:hypothetical protein J7L48_07475, partial [bacterium]|nr:hypothetical protein [bacterium]